MAIGFHLARPLQRWLGVRNWNSRIPAETAARWQANCESLLTTIDQLYAAAIDPSRWNGFLASLAAQFEAQNAFVCEVEYRKRSLAYTGLPQPARAHMPVQRYENLIDEDPRTPAFRNSGVRPVHCRMATTTDRLHGSRAYREYLKPLGIEYTMVVVLPMRDGATRDFGLTRGAGGRPFDDDDCAWMNRLIPHVERAFAIGGALETNLAPAPQNAQDAGAGAARGAAPRRGQREAGGQAARHHRRHRASVPAPHLRQDRGQPADRPDPRNRLGRR